MDDWPPVLCINLAGAKKRWENINVQVSRAMPGARLERIDAIHWQQLPPDLPLSLFSRYFMRPGHRARTGA